jgi:hypothetical protein
VAATSDRHRRTQCTGSPQAIPFKNHLAKQLWQQDESALAQGDAPPHLGSASRLFFWLAGRPGFRSRISYSDADYFNLSAKDTAVAKADHAMSTSVRERLSRMRAMSVPRAKTITTYLYPVGDDFRTVVEVDHFSPAVS